MFKLKEVIQALALLIQKTKNKKQKTKQNNYNLSK